MNQEDKNKIAEIMERHEVVVGYLFGSAARGTMGPHSDIDIGVIFNKEVSKEEDFKRRMTLSMEISDKFNVSDTDIININGQTNPVLLYDVVLQGEIILNKDPGIRSRLARMVLRSYEDTRYLRETSYRILREQIKSGEYGCAPATNKKYVPA